eukprot:2851283-Rhodomonas_salina.2
MPKVLRCTCWAPGGGERDPAAAGADVGALVHAGGDQHGPAARAAVPLVLAGREAEQAGVPDLHGARRDPEEERARRR